MSQILLQYTFTYEKTDQKVKIICESSSDPCLGKFLAFPDFPGGSVVKNSPAMQETWVQSMGQKDFLEKEIATHSNILAWEIPWTEERGAWQATTTGMQSWT